uniref:Uncharacterized protein n=1 Tax=Cannabis sativa TaxID=3483 RepID=A0A803Q353_CANSA
MLVLPVVLGPEIETTHPIDGDSTVEGMNGQSNLDGGNVEVQANVGIRKKRRIEEIEGPCNWMGDLMISNQDGKGKKSCLTPCSTVRLANNSILDSGSIPINEDGSKGGHQEETQEYCESKKDVDENKMVQSEKDFLKAEEGPFPRSRMVRNGKISSEKNLIECWGPNVAKWIVLAPFIDQSDYLSIKEEFTTYVACFYHNISTLRNQVSHQKVLLPVEEMATIINRDFNNWKAVSKKKAISRPYAPPLSELPSIQDAFLVFVDVAVKGSMWLL